MVDLTVSLAARPLGNPVMTAAGCAGNGRELARFVNLADLGAFVTPTTMLDPRPGARTPRTMETASGILSATGCPGPGAAHVAAHDLPWLRAAGATVVASIGGASSTEFASVAAILRESPAFASVVGVEVNLSLPSSTARGAAFDADPMAAAKVIALVREQLPRDVVVLAKLSVDVAEPVAVASACVKAGAEGLTLANGPVGMAIDPDRIVPALGEVDGRLSGPAIRPLVVRAIWHVRAAMLDGRLPTVPIVGVGGVRSGRDALELVAAGATAVQVGSATFADPTAPTRVHDELADLLRAAGWEAFTDVISAAHGR